MTGFLKAIVMFASYSVSAAFSVGWNADATRSRPFTMLRNSNVNLFESLDMDMPDFDEIFSKIQQVSPLARSVIDDNDGRLSVADGKQPIEVHVLYKIILITS